MRTYDPADSILYVHLAPAPAARAVPAPEECRELPAGYANASLRDRIGPPRAVGARPALVLLHGWSAPAPVSSPAQTTSPGTGGLPAERRRTPPSRRGAA